MSDQQVQMLTFAFLVDSLQHWMDMASPSELLLYFPHKASCMNSTFKAA